MREETTQVLDSSSYMTLMVPFLRRLPDLLRQSGGKRWYGTGESAHWPVQSNMNLCAALAVMATDPDLENYAPRIPREEILEIALDLFRYAMRTHRTGDWKATDGKSWGHHWISVLGAERMAHGVNALEPYLTELETENEAYDAAVKQRTVARALVVTEDTESLRKRMHEEFNVLCLLAQSFSVAVPSDAASNFVLKLNQLIAETNAAYNRRMGHSKGNSSETPSTEEPGDSGETPTDPGTDGERPGEL